MSVMVIRRIGNLIENNIMQFQGSGLHFAVCFARIPRLVRSCYMEKVEVILVSRQKRALSVHPPSHFSRSVHFELFRTMTIGGVKNVCNFVLS